MKIWSGLLATAGGVLLVMACNKIKPGVPAPAARLKAPASLTADSSKGYVYSGTSDSVFCIRTSDGSRVWARPYGISSSPAVSNGMVYFGSSDGRLYALDAVTGAFKWNFTTNAGYIYSTPQVYNNTVYFGGMDNFVYAVDATTGASKWTFETGNVVVSSPTVYHIHGKPYVIIGSNDKKLYVLDAADGSLYWKRSFYYMIRCNPAVYDNRIVIVTPSFKPHDPGIMYCLNVFNGADYWSLPFNQNVVASPSINNGAIYIPNSSSMYKLNLYTSALEWSGSWKDFSVSHAPVFYNGDVFYGDSLFMQSSQEYRGLGKSYNAGISMRGISGPTVGLVNQPAVYVTAISKTSPATYLFALDPEKLNIIWKYRLGDADKYTETSPVVYDETTGNVYNPGISGAN